MIPDNGLPFWATLQAGLRLREDRGIVPLKNLGGGAEVLLSPPIFRKCLANLQCKKSIRIKEKENETHVTVIDIQALSYSHITL